MRGASLEETVLRHDKGEGFTESFDSILSNGYEVPKKASATEIFVSLLSQEKESANDLASKQDHAASRARTRLLQSAAQLWNDTGARLELKPLLADVLGVTKKEVSGLVKDAASDRRGRNRKTQEATGIIGQRNLASLRPQLLGERFELGRFLGKTLLYGADVPENFLNQRGASILKALTGGDPVTLEFKNSNESPSITCNFNVIVTCNSRLTVHLEGDTDAWRRRLIVIPYEKSKPDHVIHDLDKRILATEASGVLNFALEGLDKLRADDWQLRLTPGQQAAVDNLLLESDGHTLFVRESLVRFAGEQLTVADCFAAYVEFCNQRGWAALTRKKFGDVIYWPSFPPPAFRLDSRMCFASTSANCWTGWKPEAQISRQIACLGCISHDRFLLVTLRARTVQRAMP